MRERVCVWCLHYGMEFSSFSLSLSFLFGGIRLLMGRRYPCPGLARRTEKTCEHAKGTADSLARWTRKMQTHTAIILTLSVLTLSKVTPHSRDIGVFCNMTSRHSDLIPCATPLPSTKEKRKGKKRQKAKAIYIMINTRKQRVPQGIVHTAHEEVEWKKPAHEIRKKGMKKLPQTGRPSLMTILFLLNPQNEISRIRPT